MQISQGLYLGMAIIMMIPILMYEENAKEKNNEDPEEAKLLTFSVRQPDRDRIHPGRMRRPI
jgi:hypothetical protein